MHPIELELLTLPLLERFRLIQRLINTLGAGESTAEPTQASDQLTVEQAADILNVSEPYIVTLLEKDEISHTHIDSQYHVDALDLFYYKLITDRKRREVLRQLTQEAQEMGFYDHPPGPRN